MLQRDYISRLIREFMAALQRFLEKDEIKERHKAAEELYRMYFGSYEFYHTSTIDQVMESFLKYPTEERLDRMEMLAELYYAEADMLSEPTRTVQLNMALSLFDFVDRHGKTYSKARIDKICDIERRIRK